jgi:hypothetical protein
MISGAPILGLLQVTLLAAPGTKELVLSISWMPVVLNVFSD